MTETPATSFRFEQFDSADAAKSVLANILPEGSSIQQIEHVMKEAGAKCYPVQGHVLACVYNQRPRLFVRVSWSLGFYLTDEDRLHRTEITRALTGP